MKRRKFLKQLVTGTSVVSFTSLTHALQNQFKLKETQKNVSTLTDENALVIDGWVISARDLENKRDI